MIKKNVLLLLMLIFLSYSVLGGLDIDLKRTDYGQNQPLDGSFNFSFSGELNADTPIVVSINGVSFEEILENFLGVDATDKSYRVSGDPVSSATIVFEEAGSNTSFGIDLTQGDEDINDPYSINELIFNIIGSGDPSPMLPSINLGEKLVWNYVGGKISGQYVNPGIPYLYSFKRDGSANIKPREAFCEKTTIKAAPEYKIIADVKKASEDVSYELLAFMIDDIIDTIPSTCDPNGYCCTITDVSTEFRRQNCKIEKGLDLDKEKYLCITTGLGTGTGIQYIVGKEIRDDKFSGYYVDEDGDVNPQTNTDYFIWYEYAKFETNLSGIVSLNDFTELIKDDYPAEGNLIPITIKTKGKGKIELVDLFIDVEMTDAPSSSYEMFTPIISIPAKVSSSVINIQPLDSNFLVDLRTPLVEGTYTLTVSIGSETKSKTINVVSQPFAWIEGEPEFPGVSQDVIFNGSESISPAGLDIVSYKWDFGDDSSIGNGSVVKHAYNRTGDFNVKLTITDSNGVTGIDEIVISVRSIIGDLGVALNATELTIVSMKNYLSNAEEHVNDSADLLGINTVLDNATTELSLLKIRYNGTKMLSDATREIELGKISNDLYVLMDNIPKSFNADSFEFQGKLVNTEDIPDVSKLGVQVDNEQSFKQGLLDYQEDINVKGEARLVHIVYVSDKEKSFILIKKKIDTSNGLKGKIYEASDNIKKVITADYEAVIPNSVYRWAVSTKEIVYTVDGEDIMSAIEKSKTFVIPPLDELGAVGTDILEYGFNCGNGVCDSGEDKISCPDDCKVKYPIGFIIFLVVLTIIGIIYINFYRGKFSLKRLKKDIKDVGKKKKTSLFKNEKDLINLSTYIKNSLKKGMTIQQIKYVLMQKGWTDSQINGAFKKIKK